MPKLSKKVVDAATAKNKDYVIWDDVDVESSCFRLSDSKEGYSVRPIGLPVVEFLEARRGEFGRNCRRRIQADWPIETEIIWRGTVLGHYPHFIYTRVCVHMII
jgi:hypothetical protein